jgi:hypothetical protein
LSTVRVGQLTGTTGDQWPDLVDARGWPLLTDTGRWGLWGVDLGANTEHPDVDHPGGRLFIFFGDVAEMPGKQIPRNADLVAWTDERKVLLHGGHQALGWTFVLPNREAGAPDTAGQPEWRFCSKCNGLFWAPHGQPAGVCPRHRRSGLVPDRMALLAGPHPV